MWTVLTCLDKQSKTKLNLQVHLPLLKVDLLQLLTKLLHNTHLVDKPETNEESMLNIVNIQYALYISYLIENQISHGTVKNFFPPQAVLA